MNAPAFGLYASRALQPAQRANPGATLALDTPVFDGGVALFRHSFWLPMPAALAQARALRLAAASTLRARFTARRFNVALGNSAWFNERRSLGSSTLRIGFTWPARVVAVPAPSSNLVVHFEMLRADGEQVADEPVLSGHSGADLAQAWVGSPLVLRVTASVPLQTLDAVRLLLPQSAPRALPARAASMADGGSVTAIEHIGIESPVLSALASPVSQLTLAGTPTSPRLKLWAELPGNQAARLLWQELVPGEQSSTTTLPAAALPAAWAPALDQLRQLAEDPGTLPELLRLDIESDAPCTVTLDALQLALEADFELLTEPQRLTFDGQRNQSLPLHMQTPAGGNREALTLGGRVVMDATAGPGGALSAAGGRRGALLVAGHIAQQPALLTAPQRPAGLALAWQPLSDRITGRLRLAADGGSGTAPGARHWVEQGFELDTPEPGWLALRWPALDLQAQPLWIELSLATGMGVWLFADDAATASHAFLQASANERQTLEAALAWHWLPALADTDSWRALSVHVGGALIADELPAQTLALVLPASHLGLLDTQPLVFTGGARGTVTVESARLTLRL